MATVPAPGKRAPSGVVMAVLGREDAHVPLVPVLDGTAVEVQATELGLLGLGVASSAVWRSSAV